MKIQKLWYLVTLVALTMLPLIGCSGGDASPVKQSPKGYEVTVNGQVDKSTAKSVALSPYSTVSASTVYVIDAQAGTVLTSGAIDSNGSFKNLTFTMPSAKSVLVFKAVVAAGTFRSVVPIDLSNPPATVGASNPITIAISSNTDAIAKTVSQFLGLSGVLGDGGQTLASKTKTYADALALVTSNGGQTLAYTGNGLALVGSVNSTLLPAKAYTDFTADDVLNIKLGGAVSSAFIPGNNPIVNLTVTDSRTGKGIAGLPASKFTVHFAQLKSDGSTWLNYQLNPSGTFQGTSDRSFLPASIPAAKITAIDKGDGSYTLVLGIDVNNNGALVLSKADTATATSAPLTYDANLIHRVAISVNATGAINPATNTAIASNPNNVAGLVYDFIPKTGSVYANPKGGNFARDVVTMAACDSCHGPLVNHGHHFGSRPDTKICVTCHTVQNKKTDRLSTEFTFLIHTLHMGHELPKPVTDIAGVDAHHIKYPQDARNCATCHKGKDGENWKTVVNQNACLSCHNNVDPVNGSTDAKTGKTNHSQVGATACNICHSETALPVSKTHLTPISTANNPNVPVGQAKLTFEITDATLDANNKPVIKFKFNLDGNTQFTYKTGDATIPVTKFGNVAGTNYVLVTGYVPETDTTSRGAGTYPTIRVDYAKAQDGITNPDDFNANVSTTLDKLVDGTGGTLSYDAATGVYTATLTAALTGLPATGTKMATARILGYGTFAKPGTTAGVDFQNVSKAITQTGYAARRAIVTSAKCNSCHEQLGSLPNFHSGMRNDAPTCSACHFPNLANNGWAVNASTFVHALHGASKRTVPYTWHKTVDETTSAVTWSGEAIGYPGVLRNCEQCHVAGSYDFSGTANRAAVDRLLYTTNATGIPANTTKTQAASIAPYVIAGTDYGTAGAATNLVSSPVSAACFSCHDTATAKAHMVSNGGSIYEPRASAITKKEACLICHGPRGADTTLPVTGAVPTIKTVHRWW